MLEYICFIKVFNIFEQHFFQIVESVELYDISNDKWIWTTALPRPLYGGTVTVVANRLFYFGGIDVFGDVSNSAFEFVPQANGMEFNKIKGAKQVVNSYWVEHRNLTLNSSKFLVAIGYEL